MREAGPSAIQGEQAMKSVRTGTELLARMALVTVAGLLVGVVPQSASAAMVSESPLPAPLGDPGVQGTTTLYEASTIFTGVSLTTVEFAVPMAGFLDVTLRDMEFPALAGALSFALVQQGSVIGLINGSGRLDLDIEGPQTLFGYVYGVGAPGISTASYFLNISYAPIPLPAAVWMLLSGLALTGWVGRRRRGAGADRLETAVAG
jgi:hypothetical protein